MKVTIPKPSLLPQSLSNLLESVNVGSRIVLKAAQGAERTVDGVDQIATLMLKQQRNRLLAELQPVQLPILDADVVELAAE